MLHQVELLVDIRDDLVVDLREDDALHFDVNKVVEGVNVLLEQSADLQESWDELFLFLESAGSTSSEAMGS